MVHDMKYYSCTNENLEAICTGLDVRRNDKILGICGSGDQMISTLEYYPSRVVAVDNVLRQLEIANSRIKQIRDGNFERFLEDDYDFWDKTCNKRDIDKRKEYFGDITRFNKIRRNVDRIELDGPVDVRNYIKKSRYGEFDKIYLSNALLFNGNDDIYSLYETFSDLNDILKKDGLVYVSNGWEVKSKLKSNPKGFEIDLDLTVKVNSIKDEWDPVIFRKI